LVSLTSRGAQWCWSVFRFCGDRSGNLGSGMYYLRSMFCHFRPFLPGMSLSRNLPKRGFMGLFEFDPRSGQTLDFCQRKFFKNPNLQQLSRSGVRESWGARIVPNTYPVVVFHRKSCVCKPYPGFFGNFFQNLVEDDIKIFHLDPLSVSNTYCVSKTYPGVVGDLDF
jgi:hypothetical protein